MSVGFRLEWALTWIGGGLGGVRGVGVGGSKGKNKRFPSAFVDIFELYCRDWLFSTAKSSSFHISGQNAGFKLMISANFDYWDCEHEYTVLETA
jgi:hypothetical protein